jgi:hypothetical protein
MLTHPQNQPIWQRLGLLLGDNILFEQYLLSACVEYHRSVEGSAYPDIDLACLFDSVEQAFAPDAARQVGYTHLIGGAKRNDALVARLEERVARDYPERYECCLRYLHDHTEKELIV